MPTTYKVTVLPSNTEFECSANSHILAAALESGFALPYGCRKGNCGTCKAQVLEGEVDLDVESTYSLSSFEADQGFTLICSAYPCSDVTIEMEGLEASDIVSVARPRQFKATVESVARCTPDMWCLAVEADSECQFRPGQFAEIRVPGTAHWRSYSMANDPSDSYRLTFLIREIPGGLFSTQLSKFKPGDELEVRGPHGSFWVREHVRPIVLVGGGAGLAPLWSILQDLTSRSDRRPISMFYGVRTSAELLYINEIEACGKKLGDFRFVAALSEEAPDPTSSLKRGLITEVLQHEMGARLGSCDVYLCGPPAMVDAALPLLEGAGLEERRSIFYDKFTAS